ncbi:MAG: hypothetical protein ACI9TH_001293, partial [Kiritimatiellia bacterium]
NILFPTYLESPTPGAANSISTTIQSRQPDFSHKRGFYENPFTLSLTANDPTETLRYTMDGSRPSASHGTVYTTPFTVAPSANAGAITVRAVSSRPGYADSDVRAHTFIFIADVLRQPVQPPDFPTIWDPGHNNIQADYAMDPDIVDDPAYSNDWQTAMLSLPTLSIATEIGNLWDINGSRGIYDHGTDDGIGSERAVSAEFIFPESRGDDFQLDCGLRIQGGSSRVNDVKHSLSLRFRGIYGEGKLDFPLFPGSPVSSYDSIALRAEYNNSWTHWDAGQRGRGTLIRDDWARKAMLDMSNPSAGEGRYVHLYLNGLYWGVYNLCERPNHSHYAAYNKLADDSLIDARNGGAVINGSNVAWNEMVSFTNNWTEIQKRLRIDQYLDFTIVQGFTGNRDLKTTGGNWRSAGGGPDQLPFELYPWDTERTFESTNDNAANVTKAAQIFNELFELTEFRVRLGDRIHAHLFNDGPLSAAANLARWQAYTNQLYYAINAEAARWGDYKQDTIGEPSVYTRNSHWIPESTRLVNSYFPARTAEALTDWKNANWYPSVEAPAFSQHGGAIPRGFNLTITPGPSGQLYYTVDGSDPRMEGGMVHPSARSGPVSTNLLNTTTVRARMLVGNAWSALNGSTFYAPVTNLVVTEIMYNPPDPLHAFIELENGGDHTLVLNGVQFTRGIRATISVDDPPLAAGEKILFVRDQAAFEVRYGTGHRIVGTYEGELDKGGEQLTLIDGQGNVVLDFAYNNSRSWPCTPDGTGHSLVPLTSEDALLDFGGHWRASAFIGGSPGATDPEPISDLLINEVLAHTDFSDPAFPAYDSNDRIELYNGSSNPVELTDWYLSDDRYQLTKWAIPGTNILAGTGWMAFDEVHHFHNPTNLGFGLNKNGEEVLLSYLPTNGIARVADCVRFKGEENGISMGRFPDGGRTWYHLTPTLGTANAWPAQSQLVISEIMYHPAATQSHPEDNSFHEFIELHNPGGSPVVLETSAGPWRLDGGIGYTFPSGVSVPAGGYVLVVNFAPTNSVERNAFLTHYQLDPATPVYGPTSGKLSNRGERIAIEKPQDPDEIGEAPSWVIVDEVFYYDQTPFSAQADGRGASLHRLLPQPGTPGQSWISLPPLPLTQAELAALSYEPPGAIRWNAQAGVNYQLEYKNHMNDPNWILLGTMTGSGPVQVTDPNAANTPFRLYRLRALP